MYFSRENKIIVWLITALISLTAVTAINIDVIIITPDDNIDPGIQIAPAPGNIKQITITAEVTDLDGVNNIKTVISTTPFGIITLNKMNDVDSDTGNYSNSFYINFYDAPVTYPIKVTAEDYNESKTQKTSSFDYMESITLELDTNNIDFLNPAPSSSSTVTGDKDITTLNNPTIQNYGNTIIDTETYGTDLNSSLNDIPIDNIQYSFVGIDWNNELAGTLDYNAKRKNISLYYGTLKTNEISYKLYIPTATQPGSYSGTVTLTAVKGQGNRAPVLHYIEDVTVIEGNLVKVIPNATDLDGDSLTYTFTFPLNLNGEWQTQVGNKGIYTATITVDDTEFQDSQNITIAVLGEEDQININLVPAWNLISIPLIPTNDSIDIIMGNCSYNKIWRFNPDQSWASTDTGLTALDIYHGYWIDRTGYGSNCTITVEGTLPESTTINVSSAWTLVGYPSLTPKAISTFINSSLYNRIWQFNSDQSWTSTDTGLTNMTPGKGYWIDGAMTGSYDVVN